MAEGSSNAPRRLEPRGDRSAPLVFKQGSRPPYAIRWYGATSLWGHFRNFVSTAIARESVDSRDWMRPLDASEMLANAARVLGVDAKGTLLESIGRPLWIDWVADTGDDRDVSEAVARMVFDTYAVDDGGTELALPRGDVLLFGGDTAYPVATTEEIYRRVVQPWNEVLREPTADRSPRRRVLLGIPGNHDWYDGLDGFGRLFRKRPPRAEQEEGDSIPAPSRAPSAPPPSGVGRLARRLHLDELRGSIDIVAGILRGVGALWSGRDVEHRKRLALDGYDPVQEASFWALPLAPGLDLWGVDRQLGRLDYRQRSYFQGRRRDGGSTGGGGVWLVAPDPALSHGEPWVHGQKMLGACDLSFERDRVLYQCGDMHRTTSAASWATRCTSSSGRGRFPPRHTHRGRPERGGRRVPGCPDDDALTSLQVPFRLMLGRSGLPRLHIAAGIVAAMQLRDGTGTTTPAPGGSRESRACSSRGPSTPSPVTTGRIRAGCSRSRFPSASRSGRCLPRSSASCASPGTTSRSSGATPPRSSSTPSSGRSSSGASSPSARCRGSRCSRC